MALTRVFEPIRIRNVEIPNRVVRTAHDTGLNRGSIGDALINYHAERAKGGVGLTILEVGAVHRSTALGLRVDDDGVIEGYQRLMDKCRPHGMRVFQQLWHGGHQYYGVNGSVPWSASDVPSLNLGAIPVPMTQAMIDEVVAAFAAAAVRSQRGGLDGVELHAAHGYLFHQFLSPMINRRTDQYGGPLENRMRLLQQALRAVRGAVGPDYPVGIRVSASTATGSLKEDEIAQVVQGLEAERLIDFLDVSYGDYYNMDAVIGGMHQPTGYELQSSGRITAVSKVPRIITGRFRTLDDVEQVLREGTADLVSMVRAHIADPAIVRKTREGRADQVRPCLGCSQGCIGGISRTGHIGCTVNPAVGYEGTLSEDLITQSPTPKKVLVVGGGPAGMEAARVAALRGHRVVLAEASADLGGAVNVARRAPKLQGLADITMWLEREMYRLGVEVRLGSYMDAEAIRAEQADHVVLATGSLPRVDGFQMAAPGEPARGADLPHVISSTELLTNPNINPGANALVMDDIGHYEAVAAAEFLVEQGVAVTWITRFPMFAPQVETFNRAIPALERLQRGEFNLLVRHHLVEIRPGECAVRPMQSSKPRPVPADLVVLVQAAEPLRELYDELRDTLPGVVLIGDAATPRDVQFAISDGHMAARAL
jgi:2,4-dienoyl-CoA reductase-like NADH-dependent reductase (Old Yellow Enzyme family)